MSIEVYYAFCDDNMVISRQPVDHEMCVHAFGGTLSSCRSNYFLKRTSVDGEDNQFQKEAAESLQNNFYVDELQKSVEDGDKVIKLMKEVKVMCA